MHSSVEQYLAFLNTKHRAPATVKVVCQDLAHFAAWWEGARQRTFDPALLRHEDLRDWRLARQRDDGAAGKLTEGWTNFALKGGNLH